MTREAMASIGPCAIRHVPVSNFCRPALTREQLHELWKLIGPSAERNMARNPLWIVITMAYYEGLAHATGLLHADDPSELTVNGRRYIRAQGDIAP